MIIKFLLISCISISFAFAQTSQEEAIILNQELQFLEESIQNVEVISANRPVRANSQTDVGEQLSLEEQYFNGEDNVSTRSAAPKRRRN